MAVPRAGDRAGGADRAVRVPKAAELVATDLRRRIVRGELAEGDILPTELELMTSYGVSRPTVREALRVLESEALVSVRRGARGGSRVETPKVAVAARYAGLVLQMGGTTLQDVFRARRVIEPAAVRMLGEKPTKAKLDSLRAHHAYELEVIDDTDEFAAAAAAFHELVIELAGNNTLKLVGQMLLNIVQAHNRDTLERAAGRRSELSHAGTDHHGRLIELLSEGKIVEAEDEWLTHIIDAEAAALRHLGPGTVIDASSI
jgi:DNA-binding FadR family transcriptional regulator